jgi:hypothetical protein
MKRTLAAIVLGITFAFFTLPAEASQFLNIPPRQQWDDNKGYCGECCIQQSALFFGTYVSQYVCREIYDPTKVHDVDVEESAEKVLDALRLTHEQFDTSTVPAPQYRSYLVWIKQHLQKRHPVLFVTYTQDGYDSYYDHIMIATGFTAREVTNYSKTDRLFFNDNYESYTLSRRFGTLCDTRAMNGNGAYYYYCIPKRYDYGCAVTGIRDDSGVALPVTVTVDRSDEPNLIQGEDPVQLNATVEVNSLTAGQSYTLYRYDDCHNVPTKNYTASTYTSANTFVATSTTQKFSDHFMSDGIVIYRCVPTGK